MCWPLWLQVPQGTGALPCGSWWGQLPVVGGQGPGPAPRQWFPGCTEGRLTAAQRRGEHLGEEGARRVTEKRETGRQHREEKSCQEMVSRDPLCQGAVGPAPHPGPPQQPGWSICTHPTQLAQSASAPSPPLLGVSGQGARPCVHSCAESTGVWLAGQERVFWGQGNKGHTGLGLLPGPAALSP